MTIKQPSLSKSTHEKITIGWNEYVDLPDFDIWDLPTKMDTGARSSSLHVENIQILPYNKVKFTIVVDGRKPQKNKTVIRKISRRALVRTSHEDIQNRVFIRTLYKLGPIEEEIEMNLVNRTDLRFRMILGRTAIAKYFLIDSGRKRLLSK